VHRILELDKQALFWINAHHSPVLDAILLPIALSGEVAAIWLVVCIGLLIFGKAPERKTALLLLLTMLAVDRLIAANVHHIFDRVRPYLALHDVRQMGIDWKTGSFPSGHAHSVCIAAIILGSRYRKLIWPLVAFAVLTLYSRPYFGMHYPLDTLAGALLGIAAGFGVLGVERLIGRRKEKANADKAN